MKKPKPRSALPPRTSENDKRELEPSPDTGLLLLYAETLRHGGSAKHKAAPHRYGLPPYLQPRGDSTLCDTHAGFTPERMPDIPRLLRRGMAAGLVSASRRLIWTVDDDGWIFEGRETNVAQREYHGYPLRPSDPFDVAVYRRFQAWAADEGTVADRQAAERCRELYGFKR